MDGRQLLVVDEGGKIVSEYRNNLYSQNASMVPLSLDGSGPINTI